LNVKIRLAAGIESRLRTLAGERAKVTAGWRLQDKGGRKPLFDSVRDEFIRPGFFGAALSQILQKAGFG